MLTPTIARSLRFILHPSSFILSPVWAGKSPPAQPAGHQLVVSLQLGGSSSARPAVVAVLARSAWARSSVWPAAARLGRYQRPARPGGPRHASRGVALSGLGFLPLLVRLLPAPTRLRPQLSWGVSTGLLNRRQAVGRFAPARGWPPPNPPVGGFPPFRPPRGKRGVGPGLSPRSSPRWRCQCQCRRLR